MNRNKKKESPARPFFARFLEQQELEKVAAGLDDDVKTTLKYPSDNEDSGT